MKQYFSFFPILFGVFVAIILHTFFLPLQSNKTPQQPAFNTTSTNANPKTLSIPRLNIHTSIEAVGLDKNKAMETPSNFNTVAWYKLGFKPGEKGNAVIAGHYDDYEGPSIFYNLKNLEPGDEIIVTDEKNNDAVFIVTKEEIYLTDTFPMQEVFGKTHKKRLNLITCEGSFDKASKKYSHRTVIFAELKEKSIVDNYSFIDTSFFTKYLYAKHKVVITI